MRSEKACSRCYKWNITLDYSDASSFRAGLNNPCSIYFLNALRSFFRSLR